MNRQISFEQYRRIDLAIFAALLAVFETILSLAAVRWFPELPYSLSVTAAITAIVMMRWGGWAMIHAALGGLVSVLAYGRGSIDVFAVYVLGNLLSALALPFLLKIGKEKTRGNVLLSLLFGLCVILLMQIGRGVISLLLGGTFRQMLGFVTTDIVSDLFTLIIVWIVRRLDGVFEDQKIYLQRLRREQEKKKQKEE